MGTRYYKPTVIVCALSWFLVGLHFPALHALTHHGGARHWLVVSLTLLFAIAAVGGLWILLRLPGQSSQGPDSGPSTA